MQNLTVLAARLRDAARITVLTGAGVSAASGVPTFRGENGLWRKVRAETLATAEAFENDPTLVWEWYDWRRGMIRGAQPNAAHHALAAWTRARPGVTVITQNVDGLHERAGTERLVRLHGSIWRLQCWSRCAGAPSSWENLATPLGTLPPRCPHCGGLARPAVVWFGESLDAADVRAATDACVCDVFLTVGTSAIVHPAASLVHYARRNHALTAEINLEPTPASAAVDIAIQGKAEEILGALLPT
ncbi:MAG TPA: NAD-dependent deacylase [Vicinamibacterales bacterium]|nr:NAD-dependent deacylase [Vicinamibacterales bacterium]